MDVEADNQHYDADGDPNFTLLILGSRFEVRFFELDFHRFLLPGC